MGDALLMVRRVGLSGKLRNMLDERGKASPEADQPPAAGSSEAPEPVREIGGPKGPEPVRYGDWERAGRCIDF